MNETRMPDPAYAAFVGLDWAKQTHAVCIKATPDSLPEPGELAQSPEALAEWAAALKARTGGRPVALCLEIKRGALINALCIYDWLHLYPINPKTTANYRRAVYPSGQKDDPKDAELLCDFLAKHMGKLKRWVPESPEIQELRTLCEQRDALVDERTRLSHKLDDALQQYFPQAVDFAGPSHLPASWDFLRKWSSLPDLQKARKSTILAFFHALHVRRGDKLTDAFHERVQAAAPLTTNPAIVRPLQLLAVGLCKTLSTLQDLIDEASTTQHPQAFAALKQAMAQVSLDQVSAQTGITAAQIREIAAIFAEAWMNTMPWNYWSDSGEPKSASMAARTSRV